MKSKSIIGSFVFRDEGDGCLTSKYMSDGPESPFTEGCKLIAGTGTPDKFCGRYQTAWLEEKDRHVKAELLIEKNTSNGNIYKLYWYEPKNRSAGIFEGSAMLFENLLVGAYWD